MKISMKPTAVSLFTPWAGAVYAALVVAPCAWAQSWPGKTVRIVFKATPDGLQAHAQTPLSIMGLIELFRRNFLEAGFW